MIISRSDRNLCGRHGAIQNVLDFFLVLAAFRPPENECIHEIVGQHRNRRRQNGLGQDRIFQQHTQGIYHYQVRKKNKQIDSQKTWDTPCREVSENISSGRHEIEYRAQKHAQKDCRPHRRTQQDGTTENNKSEDGVERACNNETSQSGAIRASVRAHGVMPILYRLAPSAAYISIAA
jgi:hypothetical protein